VIYCPIGDGELEAKGRKDISRGLTESSSVLRDLGCSAEQRDGRSLEELQKRKRHEI